MEIRLSAEMNERVLENQLLVHHLLKKIVISPNDYDDLFQMGMIGLIKATATFDESKNVQFSTYASRCINNEINMYFRKNNKHLRTVSLNVQLAEDDNGKKLLVRDTIPDSASLEFTDKIEINEIIENAINIVLNYFPKKERIVFLFSIAGLTQKDIAERLGVSQSYISRLKSKLHIKLKEYMNNETRPIKPIFLVSVIDDKIRLIFSTTDMKKFNEVLRKVSNYKSVSDFKIVNTNDKAVIYFSAEPESFAIVANILYEAEKYGVEFI